MRSSLSSLPSEWGHRRLKTVCGEGDAGTIVSAGMSCHASDSASGGVELVRRRGAVMAVEGGTVRAFSLLARICNAVKQDGLFSIFLTRHFDLPTMLTCNEQGSLLYIFAQWVLGTALQNPENLVTARTQQLSKLRDLQKYYSNFQCYYFKTQWLLAATAMRIC